MHRKVSLRTHRWTVLVAAMATLTCMSSTASEPVEIRSEPILTLAGTAIGARVGQLVWQGGFSFTGDHYGFDGISSISFSDSEHFVAVSDRGSFISGKLLHSPAGVPSGLLDVRISPILDHEGQEAESAAHVDAEAIEVVFDGGQPVAARVGFERFTRVSEYVLENGMPAGPERAVPVPAWLAEIDNNDSIESLCIAPRRSSIADRTLIITENFERDTDNRAAALLGADGYQNLDLAKQSGIRPTDCAFLPSGDLLVLLRDERGTAPAMQIRRIAAANVREGQVMDGPLLVDIGPSEVGNMEGLGVRVTEQGEVRIVVVSDNGFDEEVPTILLEFSIIDMNL